MWMRESSTTGEIAVSGFFRGIIALRSEDSASRLIKNAALRSEDS
jgi:hypothetical protein